jgi:hypothetical protein
MHVTIHCSLLILFLRAGLDAAAEASKNMKDSEHEGTNKQITF